MRDQAWFCNNDVAERAEGVSGKKVLDLAVL